MPSDHTREPFGYGLRQTLRCRNRQLYGHVPYMVRRAALPTPTRSSRDLEDRINYEGGHSVMYNVYSLGKSKTTKLHSKIISSSCVQVYDISWKVM